MISLIYTFRLLLEVFLLARLFYKRICALVDDATTLFSSAHITNMRLSVLVLLKSGGNEIAVSKLHQS